MVPILMYISILIKGVFVYCLFKPLFKDEVKEKIECCILVCYDFISTFYY